MASNFKVVATQYPTFARPSFPKLLQRFLVLAIALAFFCIEQLGQSSEGTIVDREARL